MVGGQSPQHLVTELAGDIAAGDAEVALVVGAEAISTIDHFLGRDDAPDFTEHVDGPLEDRGFGLEGLVTEHLAAHGLIAPPAQYAVLENARRARLGLSREAYAKQMGALFAPFTRVAAGNPHAAAPTERSATELATPTDRNRPIADPYTKFLVAREKVNQGAAVLLTSVGAARRLGVPEDRLVFLAGHADLRERDLLDRADLGGAPASVMAVEHALEVAGVDLDEVSAFDLYSCFPIAVFAVCDGLGVSPADPRGLTVTGGLPFFGGPGNGYALHAIAQMGQRVRGEPGSHGLVGANGGICSKYSVGIYTTAPTPWQQDRSGALQAEVDAWPAPPVAYRADGPATIETYTVTHNWSEVTGIVIGRLDDGRRFVARSADGDEDMLSLLTDGEPLGAEVFVQLGRARQPGDDPRPRMDGLTAATAPS